MFATGAMLRETRRRLGLELADVQAQTRISERILKALEEDRLDLVPADLGRNFLRDYATFLGLSGDEHLGVHAQHDAADGPERESRSGPPLWQRSVWPPRVAALAVLVLAGIAVWHFAGSGGNGPARPAQTTSATQTVATTTRPAAARRGPPPALTLVAARGDCWLSVQVGSASGPVLYERILLRGQKVRFGLRKPLWIRFGAPGNLEATIGRRSITTSLPLGTNPVVATRKGLTDAKT